MRENTIAAAVDDATRPQPPALAPDEQRIRARAYEIYRERGARSGDAVSDWYRAEAELTAEESDPWD